ncbi:MAG: AsmA-like C-terminal region-containing protein [Chitinophagales bacterium]
MQEIIQNQPLPTTPPPKRRTTGKTILVALAIFFGALILIAVMIPLLFENQVKGLFIRELNKNLATEITIKQEDIQLSIFKNFPEASVVFKNVGIRESFERSKKNFLQAEEVSLLFNIRDIINGKYDIKNIIVKNGYCHLIQDKTGNINYKFWKDNEESSSESVSVNLEKVIMEGMDFQYLDYKYNQDISVFIHECNLKGNFSSDNYLLEIEGDVLSNRIKAGNSSYLVDKETFLNATMRIDMKNNIYSFNKSEITFDKNSFLISGSINLKGEDYYDLAINGDKINLDGLMLLLPGSVSSNLSTLESKGKIDFITTIKGNYSKTKTPAVNMEFSIKNGSISHQKFGGKINEMSFTGKYSNGENHNGSTSSIAISNFSAKQNNNPILLALEYKNFKNPYINFQLDGNFPASIIVPLAIKNAQNIEGTINLNNINIKGNIKTLSEEVSTSAPTGNIGFDNVSFVVNNETIAIPAGAAVVSNNEIVCTNLNTTFAGSDLKLNVVVNNWIQTVFPSEQKPALNINGEIISEKIDLNRLIVALGEKKTTTKKDNIAKTQTVSVSENTRYNFSGSINLTCNNFTYDKIAFNNINAILKMTPGLLTISNLSANAMAGKLNLNSTFRELATGEIICQTSGTLTGINVSELFSQFENFGQSTLTNDNIKGNITANIYEVHIKWDKNFRMDEQSVYTLCDMKIENGELINYKPLESLSNFVNVKDLKHITFSTLENKIEIKDRQVYIPAMQIKSSALDLYMSGKHSFDNVLDYQFKLSLADIMVRKFLGGNKQKEEYESDAEGGVNIYISMTGTVDDPIIKNNKKEAKQKLKESGLEEQKFIDIFKKDPETEDFKHTENAPATKVQETDYEEPQFIEFEEGDN